MPEEPCCNLSVSMKKMSHRYLSTISDSFSEKGILLENTSGISFHDINMEIKKEAPLEAKDSKKNNLGHGIGDSIRSEISSLPET